MAKNKPFSGTFKNISRVQKEPFVIKITMKRVS
jgi:hypothetical protein